MRRRLERWCCAVVVAAAAACAQAGPREDLFIAINRDNGYAVEKMLRAGTVDANARDTDGQTALYVALRNDSLKAVNALLLDATLDVDVRNSAGETALMIAALRGHTAQTQALLKRGAHVNQPGWTPLHYAATGPKTEIVALLLEAGAVVDAESPNRSTPLMMAARYGTEPSVDLLLSRGADVQRRNEKGLKAADFARLGGREALATRLAARAGR